jgi:uncharacterized repeat protein (TIGR01451 family)
MSKKRSIVRLTVMVSVLALSLQVLPLAAFLAAGNVSPGSMEPGGFGIGKLGTGSVVYADASLSAERTSGNSAKQGEERVAVTIKVKNIGTPDVGFNRAELDFDEPDNISVTGGETGNVTLGQGAETTITFYLNVGGNAATGSRNMQLILKQDSGTTVTTIYTVSMGLFRIGDKLGTTSGDLGTVAVMDIVHSISPSGGFASGQENTLTLQLKNIGNTVIKNAVLSLTLPDGMSVYNSSNSANLGYVSTGSERTVTFPITVDDEAASKNYAVTAKLSGLSYYNDDVSSEKTFYIPVNGSGTSVKNAEITNISIPSEVSGEDNFNLTFDVANKNSAALKNVKINVEVPEGILNKSRNAFVESSIPGGGSKNYSVTLFPDSSAKAKSYTLKISVSSASGTTDTDAVTQYASVYVSGTSESKTPQLMVDDYSYGGTFVQAGDQFLLDLGLFNTSASHKISNIKVTVSSEDGSIIPVNSSNSFYIDSLGKKERTDYSLLLSVKPGAEQKTTPLTVDMSYEDGSGNALTSKDVISIPVMQETRLEVDDVIAPPELYTGMQSGVSVQFYNMGKTTLNNLRVTAEGNFDTPESTSYFVGNMESGKSDSYDFTFIPRDAGTMEGKIIFTYEDASGDEQILERPFSFNIMGEMPAWEEEMPPEDTSGAKGGKLPWIIGAAVVSVLTGGGIFIWKRRKRKKLNREMEIDE